MTNLTPEIIYEDEDIIAINKPAGLVVHPDGRTKEPSVSEWLAEVRPETKGLGEPIKLANGEEVDRPGVVHRLDRETSGVMLLAKTEKGFQSLKKQFQEREIEKIYQTFLYGSLKEDRGVIKLPIGRSKNDFRKWTAQRGKRGEEREAETEYKVLQRGKETMFVEAKPKTGRTHQLRVHFKALHHPVVGDKLYASKMPTLLGFDRLALHARSIKFHDVLDVEHEVVAEYPEDFKFAIKELT